MRVVDPTLRSLDDCGCCEGLEGLTPLEIVNRPGLKAVPYRVGTHSTFFESMLAGLSTRRRPALQRLSTRSREDFSIALLDAWATVADVLTFYQERIANESYLRTATERFSILQLARLIGYELRPGVAASVYLAFTVEEAPGAPGLATIEKGTRVQSIPEPGQLPQTFETKETIEARADWNAIRPRLTSSHPLDTELLEYTFAGINTGLRVGDGVMVVPEESANKPPSFRLVAEVTPEAPLNWTKTRLQAVSSASTVKVAVLRQPVIYTPSSLTQYYLGRGAVRAADFFAEAQILRFRTQEVFENLKAVEPPPPSVLAFRLRASIFGHNAPAWNAELPAPFDTQQNSWIDKINLAGCEKGNEGYIYLDAVYPTIVKDSWVVLKNPTKASLFKVDEVDEISVSGFTLNAKVTRLKLAAPEGSGNSLLDFIIAETTVFAQSEELKLARLPIEEAVTGTEIELDGWVEGLSAGQKVIACGEPEEARGVKACEVTEILDVEHVFKDFGYTGITLKDGLTNHYIRTSLTLQANVCLADHGETRSEALGSGDASRSFQRFTLRQPPLTYVSASTPSGAASTLDVYVNNVLWNEAPFLLGHGPGERVYITRQDNEGRTTVTFGDGVMGARPPSGQENIQARYRKGIGLVGLVKAGQLSLLATRPHGVRSVTNPMPSEGAADAEALEDARQNAPLTILTLERIVSLKDYEDFARAFAGIAKAHARLDGARNGVLVTVAGPGGADLSTDSPTFENLWDAIQKASDPSIPVRLMSYRRSYFQVHANIKVRRDYIREVVVANVEAALRQAFSFEARSFGQPVHLSEVMRVMQQVEGVVAVDVDELEMLQPEDLPQLSSREPPDPDAAELLTLDPRPVEIGIMP